MKKLEFTRETTKKVWISLTGYRILIILKALMEKSRTIDELVQIIEKNKIINKVTSKDTIRIDLNTLKRAGCKISRPSKANNYKYELLSHPFTFKLSDKELRVLLRLRDKLTQEMEWQDVLIFNELYSKIASVTFNEELINEIENTKPLINVDVNILEEFSSPLIIGKKVQIIYNSPKFGKEELDIVPQKVSFENGKLYLWCYSYKYKMNSLLNIERIVKINFVDISKTIETKASYDVTYSIVGNALKTFEPKEFEEIIEKTKDSIKVLAHVENEFYFVQRLLLFGKDFKIISPDFFKEKLINKIKLMQKGYEK
ncbi:MAG: WYL domain-containing protein [Candidatus Gastranaerophilales bacterium]|nr:WYL domain-containing protein [Candidatus Gastranaerophilales bacterium]